MNSPCLDGTKVFCDTNCAVLPTTFRGATRKEETGRVWSLVAAGVSVSVSVAGAGAGTGATVVADELALAATHGDTATRTDGGASGKLTAARGGGIGGGIGGITVIEIVVVVIAVNNVAVAVVTVLTAVVAGDVAVTFVS